MAAAKKKTAKKAAKKAPAKKKAATKKVGNRWKKGMAKVPGSGRKKGTPNKTTAAMKQAIVEAFFEVGGKDYLIEVAREDKSTFVNACKHIIPKEVEQRISIFDELLAAAQEADARAREREEQERAEAVKAAKTK